MISSLPQIVDYFRRRGIAAEPLKLGFDTRILGSLQGRPSEYEVSFVGGFAAPHMDRIAWLERLADEVPLAVFGYGLDRIPRESPIHACCHGPAWGWRMYEVLQRSRITLNMHARIEADGRPCSSANNMRLFEATGVGTCLMTDWKPDLADTFEPGAEVVTYADNDDCLAKVRHYLASEAERSRISTAGQQRTLADHSYSRRMGELRAILAAHLSRKAARREVCPPDS